MRFTKTIAVIFMLLIISSLVFAQDDQSAWDIFDEPILSQGETGAWDDEWNEPAASIFYDGQYHLFKNGYSSTPYNTGAGIAHYVSDDGLSWEQASEPIYFAESLPFEAKTVSVVASNVFVEEDGTWVLYLTTYETPNWPMTLGGILRATADSPDGEWTVSDGFLLEGEKEGTKWDGMQVAYPSVVRFNDQYYMYYTGFNRRSERRIGLAISDDGVNWTKYRDEEIAGDDEAYAESTPVLVRDLGWEFRNVEVSRVIAHEDTLVMFYKSGDKIGVATSTDGINWDKSESALFAPRDMQRQLSIIGFFQVVFVDDMVNLFLEAGTMQAGTEIYALRRSLADILAGLES